MDTHNCNRQVPIISVGRGCEESLYQWQNCKKNAGHSNLIPFKEFSADHLQFNFRQEELVELIKLLGELTVKVIAPYSCSDRPAKKQPQCGNCKRIGTGHIFDVKKHSGINDEEKCPCSACVNSGDRASSWAEITIVTSKRVVFDESEGRHAVCLSGYDDENSPCVSLEGVGALTSDKDWCHVKCATHDMQFADKLATDLMDYKSRRVRFFNDYKDSNVQAKLIVVVSHPHGHYKHVSIKIWSSSEQDLSPVKKNVLDTCKGSRGAPVYILDKDKNWLSTYC